MNDEGLKVTAYPKSTFKIGMKNFEQPKLTQCWARYEQLKLSNNFWVFGMPKLRASKKFKSFFSIFKTNF